MPNDLTCKWCNKSCNGLRGLSSHERRCPDNKDWIDLQNSTNISDSLKALSLNNETLEVKRIYSHVIENYGWSYNKCKNNWVEACALSFKDNVSYYTEELTLLFNNYINQGWSFYDCLEALGKYRTLEMNCNSKHLNRSELHLTCEEYFNKIREANILPNQIGKNGGDCYQLSRKEDVYC